MEQPLQMSFMRRLVDIPLVSATTTRASPIITRLTGSSRVLRATLSLARRSVGLVCAPVGGMLDTPVRVLDRIACRGLDRVEQKFPIIRSTPEQAAVALQDAVRPLVQQLSKITNRILVTLENITDIYFFPGEDEVNPHFWPNIPVQERIHRLSVRMGKRVKRAFSEYLLYMREMSDVIGGEFLSVGPFLFVFELVFTVPNLMEAYLIQQTYHRYLWMGDIMYTLIEQITDNDGELNREFPDWFVNSLQYLEISYLVGRRYCSFYTEGLEKYTSVIFEVLSGGYKVLFRIPNIRRLRNKMEFTWFDVWRFVIDAWWVFSCRVDYFLDAPIYRRRLYIAVYQEVVNGVGQMYGVHANN